LHVECAGGGEEVEDGAVGNGTGRAHAQRPAAEIRRAGVGVNSRHDPGSGSALGEGEYSPAAGISERSIERISGGAGAAEGEGACARAGDGDGGGGVEGERAGTRRIKP